MSNRRSMLLTVCAAVAIASGCDRSASNPTASTGASVPAGADSTVAKADADERINPAIVLSVTPNPADFCNDKLATVTVNWDVSAANVPMYSIWAEAPSVHRQAWLSGTKPVDSKQTGPWVRDQTKFTMTDSTGTVIAATTVTGANCASGATPAG